VPIVRVLKSIPFLTTQNISPGRDVCVPGSFASQAETRMVQPARDGSAVRPRWPSVSGARHAPS
jgi:hypothetical protein